jgi:hypothetical protein
MVAAPGGAEEGEDDEDWGEDVSEEAVRQRQAAALGGRAAELALTVDVDRPIEDRLASFLDFVKVPISVVFLTLRPRRLCGLYPPQTSSAKQHASNVAIAVLSPWVR